MADSQTVNTGIFWRKGKGAGKRTPYYIIKGKKEELHGFPIPSPYHPRLRLSQRGAHPIRRPLPFRPLSPVPKDTTHPLSRTPKHGRSAQTVPPVGEWRRKKPPASCVVRKGQAE